MSQFPEKAKVICRCCNLISCYMTENNPGIGRTVQTYDDEILESDVPISECEALTNKYDEAYILWILGLSDLLKLYFEEHGGGWVTHTRVGVSYRSQPPSDT